MATSATPNITSFFRPTIGDVGKYTTMTWAELKEDEDIDLIVNRFYETLKPILNSVPTIKKPNNNREYPPWYSIELINK